MTDNFKEIKMGEKEKIKLLQLVLYAITDYGGSVNGEITQDDREEVAELILVNGFNDSLAGNNGSDLLIVALRHCGYGDNLVENGEVGPDGAKALRQAFGIPEPAAATTEGMGSRGIVLTADTPQGEKGGPTRL